MHASTPNADRWPTYFFHSSHSFLLWTRAQRSFSEVHVMFCECYFIYFFNGRHMLWPRLTEVRETFTRGGPWVWIEKLLLGCFPGSPYTTGWAKKWRNLAYFQTTPANFLLSRPNAAEYCNSEKNLLSTDGFSTMYATFGELWPTNPWDPRDTKFIKNDWIACDMSYFRLLDASTTTP